MTDKCLFECGISNKPLQTAGPERINSIISASKQRHDELYKTLEQSLAEDTHSEIRYHKSCVSTYTSTLHISRYKKKLGIRDSDSSSQEPPRKRRSEVKDFQFQSHCLFCGQECLPFDERHPDRRQQVMQCRTLPKSGPTFKDRIIDICDKRKDKQAEEVRIRVLGAPADLHAADAQYHKTCYTMFVSERNVRSRTKQNQSESEIQDHAFQNVIESMDTTPNKIWTSTDLYDIYLQDASVTVHAEKMTRRQLISNLTDYYGSDLTVMRIEGCASVLCFKEFIPINLKLVEIEDDEDLQLDKIIKQIKTEISSIPKTKDYDLNSYNLTDTVNNTSPTLLDLVSKLVSKVKHSKVSISLAQSIQSHISHSPNQTTLGVAIKMHHKFGSREAIDIMNDHGYISSYDEVLRFRNSAAKYIGEQGFQAMGLRIDGGPIGVWCDNYDLNVFTPNGTRETHAMAIEFTQQETEINRRPENIDISIPRINKDESCNINFSEISPVEFVHYQGPKAPIPPEITYRGGQSFDDVMAVEKSIISAAEKDLKWIKEIIENDDNDKPDIPEWSGYMTKLVREQEAPMSIRTKYVFGPLIDASPSHPDTVLTTMLQSEKFIQAHDQTFIHLVADMQLYKVILKIKWSDPERWKHLVVRPGGMHMLMSFIGCIGTLMKGSGVEEILKSAFKGTANMLNGKAWPKAMRGLRMVLTAVLKEFLVEAGTDIEKFQLKLEDLRQTPMGRFWIDCLVTPVWIALLFVRAEKEANWLLHLYCVHRMIPYFFAAAHFNYAKYSVWYLTEMKACLPDEANEMFHKGDHVCRHVEGHWNAVFSDQFGEQTYIRYGKAKGGLVGITLSPDQVSRWILSYTLCNSVSQSLDSMFCSEEDPESGPSFRKHKEEGTKRISLDTEDRKKIQQELQKYRHPLKTPGNNLINIVNGHISNDKVNVQDAVAIGEHMAAKFKNKLPKGFYDPLKKEITTMETVKKGIRVGERTVYDTEKLYARMLVTSAHRNFDLHEILSFKLAPLPFSLFDEYGDLRKGNKSLLLNKLAVFSPQTDSDNKPDVEIIDGNAMLYHVSWPKSATVNVLATNFIKSVTRDHSVYVVFDRYFKGSIKSHERERRASGTVTCDMEMSFNTSLPSRNIIMKNINNKKKLIRLLCTAQHDASLKMIDEEDKEFEHEEADINMISYMLLLANNESCQHIQVLSDDADVFVLLVYFTWKQQLTKKITMKKLDGKIIDINSTTANLGDKCLELLPLHVATGCDTVSYPFGKGKISAINLMLKHRDLSLGCIGEETTTEVELQQSGCKLFCLLYGSNTTLSMNELRYMLFTTKKDNCSNLKYLPPTDDALKYHMKRAHLQTMLWKAADKKKTPPVNVEELGWSLKDGIPHPVTTEKNAAPTNLLKIIACSCASEQPCDRKQCSCKSEKLSCTSFCKCHADVCKNEYTVRVNEDQNEIMSDEHTESDSDTEYCGI